MERRKRVLVVDDEASNRELLEALLTELGHDVDMAADGSAALAKLDPSHDLVLLDVMMAGIDGFEVARRIRNESSVSDIPICMVTQTPPDTAMTAKTHGWAARITGHCRVMQKIIEDFLDFQALEDGQIKLTLEVTVCTRKTESGVLVEVRDSGPGIADDDMKKLFVKYAKLSNMPTGGEKSSGLGLAICKRVVEMQGGKTGARNNPGGGATFWFELPGGFADC